MDKYTTQQLLTALLERTTFTNGLDFCSARDVCSLLAALEAAVAIPPLPEPYAPFGEPLLQVLVHLCSGDDTMMDDDTFYAMLDAQTTDEAEYYCECNDAVYFPAYNALGASRA
jgi:hypothetical protein